MSGRNVKSLVSGLAVAAGLTAAPVAASAQEAIMLEIIGAVRMAQPDEVRRTTAEQEQSRSRSQTPQRRAEEQASAR